MAQFDMGRIYSKMEQTPLDRFKNKNRILKNFGPPGAAVYDEFDGLRSAREIFAISGVDEELFVKIVTQLINDGAIHEEGAGAAPISNAAERPPSDENRRSVQPSAPPLSQFSSQSSRPPAAPPVNSDNSPSSSPSGSSSPSPDRQSSSRSSPSPESSRSSSNIRSSNAGREDKGAPTSPARSPLEKIIFDKYGQVGLQVYTLIDGERTAEDILNETGLSESKLVEILEFMNEQGIIKLDRPLRGPSGGSATSGPNTSGATPPGAAPPTAGGHPAMPKMGDDGVGFKPMVESGDASAGESLSPDALPIDVPVLNSHPSIFNQARTKAILSMKFGHVGNDLLKHVDSNKDFVQLSTETGLSLRDLDVILGELGKAGLISFKQLNRAEVRHRYGDNGLAVYKRFGREGLLIYQMIGKAESLRDIAARTKIEPNRAVDIIIFVHRVLGLDLPVDRDMVYRYITRAD